MKDTLIILIPGFPRDENDTTCLPGQQVFIKNLSSTFPQLNIIVLAFQYPFERKIYTWNGVTVMSFGGRNRGGISRLILWVKVRNELKKVHKNYHVCGILAFWLGECAIIAKWFCQKYKIKYLVWLCGQDAKRGNRYVHLVKPESNDLVAISDFVAEQYDINYGKVPLNIIPLGIDPSIFGHPPPFKDIDIIGAGSLIPLKQFDLFIEVVKSLTVSYPKLRVVICGEGPMRPVLTKLIEQNGLDNIITLSGELPHPELLAMFQRSRILLHTSNYEGLGLVCYEALYAGAHVVRFTNPMENNPGIYIAADIEEMIRITEFLLAPGSTAGQSNLPYPAKDSVMKLMGLFGYIR